MSEGKCPADLSRGISYTRIRNHQTVANTKPNTNTKKCACSISRCHYHFSDICRWRVGHLTCDCFPWRHKYNQATNQWNFSVGCVGVQAEVCNAARLRQTVKARGCQRRTLVNQYCYGQCNSFFIPQSATVDRPTPRSTRAGDDIAAGGRDPGRPGGAALAWTAFRSCSYCQPKTVEWIRVRLRCPGRRHTRYRRRRVLIVKDCTCAALNIDWTASSHHWLLAYWTIRRQTNSRSVKSRTGQLTDYSQLTDSELLKMVELLNFICTLNLTPPVILSNIDSV